MLSIFREHFLKHPLLVEFQLVELTLMKGDKVVELFKNFSNFLLFFLIDLGKLIGIFP